MDDRDEVLRRVRDALKPLPVRAPLPDWDEALLAVKEPAGGADLGRRFAGRLSQIGGVVFESAEQVAAYLRERGCRRGYCDPQLLGELAAPLSREFALEPAFDRGRADDYEFGITGSAGAIAATGTIVLSDAACASRLGALAPWIHIAVVTRATIVSDVPAALAALPADPNVVWCTGPSSTADVEGILIRGVHGPGVQAAWLV
ncbi:MAG TPA: LUD domain-containing protein [Opitutaceae bacterium]|jgi:L-lactate dehydrogenase complex protein LldG|nr:LUD domain-containing protein [Opitutaceae bacterium]